MRLPHLWRRDQIDAIQQFRGDGRRGDARARGDPLSGRRAHADLALAFRDAIVPQIVAKGLPLNENLLRVAIALGAHFFSFCFRDVGLIISLRGSLLGAPCVFTMPSLIYLRSKRGKAAGALAKALHRFLMWFGVAMAAVGTTCVLLFR